MAEHVDAPGPRSREIALSLDHLMNHRIKNPFCEACKRAKLQNKPARSKAHLLPEDSDFEPKEFGDHITGDHLICQEGFDKGFRGESTGLVLLDVGSDWLDCFPLPSKHSDAAFTAMQDFAGPKTPVHSFYSDCSPELQSAAKRLAWAHATATPGRPKTNGKIERYVRTVIEGTTTLLEAAGMQPRFWPLAARAFCFAYNIEQWRQGGTEEAPTLVSAWEKRHKGDPFSGPKIPFGALVDFKPSPVEKVKIQEPKFGPKGVPGIFLGYVLLPGGKWKGDFLVARLEDFRSANPRPYMSNGLKK